MIANKYKVKKYCEDYTKIENYEEALSSPLRYDLHHRREISENKSRKQLIAENLYYDRPPEELIFIEAGEHISLHNAGKHPSAESRQKMSEAKKGHLVSEDTRKKISEAQKGEKSYMYGKPKSTEWKKKMSNASKGRMKGLHWHLENGHRVWTE